MPGRSSSDTECLAHEFAFLPFVRHSTESAFRHKVMGLWRVIPAHLKRHPPLARLASAGGVVHAFEQPGNSFLPGLRQVLSQQVCHGLVSFNVSVPGGTMEGSDGIE